jgi:O-antigen/teichoic acid export membrane protein
MKDDPARLGQASRLVGFFLLRGAFLLAVILGFLAEDIVRVTFGPAWLEAAPTVRILAPYAAVLPVITNLFLLLYGKGRVRESTIVRAVQVLLFVPAVIVATSIGGAAAAGWALVAAAFAGLAAMLWLEGTLFMGGAREMLLAPALAFLGSAVGALWIGSLAGGAGFWGAVARLTLVTLLYVALLLLIDRRRMIAQIRYLRALLV